MVRRGMGHIWNPCCASRKSSRGKLADGLQFFAKRWGCCVLLISHPEHSLRKVHHPEVVDWPAVVIHALSAIWREGTAKEGACCSFAELHSSRYESFKQKVTMQRIAPGTPGIKSSTMIKRGQQIKLEYRADPVLLNHRISDVVAAEVQEDDVGCSSSVVAWIWWLTSICNLDEQQTQILAMPATDACYLRPSCDVAVYTGLNSFKHYVEKSSGFFEISIWAKRCCTERWSSFSNACALFEETSKTRLAKKIVPEEIITRLDSVFIHVDAHWMKVLNLVTNIACATAFSWDSRFHNFWMPLPLRTTLAVYCGFRWAEGCRNVEKDVVASQESFTCGKLLTTTIHDAIRLHFMVRYYFNELSHINIIIVSILSKSRSQWVTSDLYSDSLTLGLR